MWCSQQTKHTTNVKNVNLGEKKCPDLWHDGSDYSLHWFVFSITALWLESTVMFFRFAHYDDSGRDTKYLWWIWHRLGSTGWFPFRWRLLLLLQQKFRRRYICHFAEIRFFLRMTKWENRMTEAVFAWLNDHWSNNRLPPFESYRFLENPVLERISERSVAIEWEYQEKQLEVLDKASRPQSISNHNDC